MRARFAVGAIAALSMQLVVPGAAAEDGTVTFKVTGAAANTKNDDAFASEQQDFFVCSAMDFGPTLRLPDKVSDRDTVAFPPPNTQSKTVANKNQRFFDFLRVNESAFVAFSAGDAPGVNGGSVNAGLGMLVGGMVDISALVGYAGMSVVGDAEFGPMLTGKARMTIANHLQLFGMYAYTNITHFRVEDETGGHTGVSNANYFGIGVVVR